MSAEAAVAARARDWRHAQHAAVCDVLEPWEHGTVVRATPFASYFDFNLVRVEDDPAMSLEALAAFADEALAGLEHRRLDFEVIAAAEPLRAGFEEKGWKTSRLVSMRHSAPPPPPAGRDVRVEEVTYDAVHELRAAWMREDFPDYDPASYLEQARDVALRRDAQVLAVREGGRFVAFSQLEHDGAGAEITQVFVHPEHRGAGRGTAMTRATIEAAGAVEDLWITADDEDRPKELYGRLGFRPAWTSMEFTLWP